MGGVKMLFGDNTMHLEKRKGTRDEARKYCMKDESRVPGTNYTEYGKWGTCQGQRTDLTELVQRVKDGADDCQLLEETPSQAFRYMKHIQHARFAFESKKAKATLRKDLHVTVITGAAGTGKTSWAFANALNDAVFLLHSPTSKGQVLWFDGYTGEKTLIIDDYNTDSVPYDTMLRLLDIYPFTCPIKGSMCWAQWTQVIITSNLPHTSWYAFGYNADALERRIHCCMTMESCDMTIEPPTWTYSVTKGNVPMKGVIAVGAPDIDNEDSE